MPLLPIALALSIWVTGTETPAETPADTSTRAQVAAPPAADGAQAATRTASGLSYTIIKAAPGAARPTPTDVVTVHYEGRLEDGTVFESTRATGEPASFPLSQVIPGWTEGLGLMTVGSVYELVIPPSLAYGDAGVPGRIPPASTLTYEVELLAIEEGAGIPGFRPLDPEKARTAADGLRYEVLGEGRGGAIPDGKLLMVDYAFWGADGGLVASSARDGRRATLSSAQMPYPFLRELRPALRAGGRYLVEVPPEKIFGPAAGPDAGGELAVWFLAVHEVKDPPPTPGFERPDPTGAAPTASGIRFRIVDAGSGASPRTGGRVTFHYAGWRVDGTLIDASYPRGKPVTVALDQAMAGWREGLRMLKEGGSGYFELPPALAYGSKNPPANVGPDATVVFHLELVRVLPPAGGRATPPPPPR